MVTAPLPTASRPGTWAAVARQIDSIRSLGIEVEVLEIAGPRGIKYLRALGHLRERSTRANLIHAHYGYCGWVSRLQRRKPVVVSFMGSDLLGVADATGRITASSRVVVEIDRRLARFVDAVIAPEDTRDALELALRVSLNYSGPHLGQFVLPASLT